ncbi:ACP S-malonyltransferase [Humidesulfovibrio idahonensis]
MGGRVVYLLSGQGGQHRQMGRALYDTDATFRDSMRELDALAESMGAPVLDELYGPQARKSDPFVRTLLTHPAIFMLEVSAARALAAQNLRPAALLGSSLGEFSAAAIAGAADAGEMLAALIACARAVEQLCPQGAMLAALGPLAAFADDPEMGREVTLACVNSENHFVLSGNPAAIADARKRLEARGLTTAPVAVSHAFHSPDMDACADAVRQAFAGVRWRTPEIPIISCRLGGILPEMDAASMGEHFAAVGREVVHFDAALEAARTIFAPDTAFVDIGPSGTLAGLARQTLRTKGLDRCFVLFSPFADGTADFDRAAALARKDACNAKATPPATGPLTACIFPGQGAQEKGMGAALFPRHPELMHQADAILGWSVEELCRDDPGGNLRQTRYTQPCLFVVNALIWLDRQARGLPDPAFLAGHSLGEFCALFAAGVLDFQTGLRLVARRAELMAQAPAGGMAAVIGLAPETIAEALRRAGLDRVEVANRNTPTQVVVSGDAGQIARAEEPLRQAGCVAYIPLKVSGAFHSRFMAEPAQAFREELSRCRFSEPRIPVVSNVTARPHEPETVAELLALQMTNPVDWLGSVRYLLDCGVERFEELGPRPVLSPLILEIRSGQPPAAPTAKTPAKPRTAPALLAVIEPERLGAESFRQEHGVRLACVCGGMAQGISSVAMVERCARAGVLSFFGTGGLGPERAREAVADLSRRLPAGTPWGVNLLAGSREAAVVDLCLEHGVRRVEASAFVRMTPDLVRYRLLGLERDGTGVAARNRIMAKLSRPEVARDFLAPPPEEIVQNLLQHGLVTPEQAQLARRVPMADDICVEGDSGGHTDQGSLGTLLPPIIRMRDKAARELATAKPVHIGAGGGLGTPEAMLAALTLGADFLVTGSVNQCSVEAGTSDLVKDMLADMEVQDTAYAPAGDMFELGARVQVLRRGVFFPARANQLYDLYRLHASLDDIPAAERTRLESRYFHRSFDEVWEECCARNGSGRTTPDADPKRRMAQVFRWYFGQSTRLAIQGVAERKVDFQIWCGPALGAFNQWVAGTDLAPWRSRHADDLALRLMTATAERLGRFVGGWSGASGV